MNSGIEGAAVRRAARRRWASARRSAIALACVAVAASAHADAVDIVGGFTQYFGPLEQPGTLLNRQTVFNIPGAYSFDASPYAPYPDISLAQIGIGQGNAGFIGHVGETQPKIEFYIRTPSGDLTHNAVAFAPTTGADVQVGDVFKLGTFTFTNGGWPSDPSIPDSQFQFVLHTVSANPALNDHYFFTTLNLHVTSGLSADGQVYDPSPVANADYLYFPDHPEMGFVGVYEAEASLHPPGASNTGSIDLYGKIGSLIPTSFENPQGLTLQASIPVVPNLSPVPEPSTWALWLAGLGAGIFRLRRGRTATA